MARRYIAFLLGCMVLDAVMANPPIMQNDPKRPTEAISRDLGVTQAQFIACFNNVNPTPGGGRPESEERVQANKSVLLPCLQKANPGISNESLDAVMDRYRPGGWAAQQPMH